MKHQKRAVAAVRKIIDMSRNVGQYPDGAEYKLYIIACGYILGDEKWWMTTDIPDGKYYEVTYNHNTDEIYVNVFNRIYSEVVKEGA